MLNLLKNFYTDTADLNKGGILSRLNNWFAKLRHNKISYLVSDNDVFAWEDGDGDGSGRGNGWGDINNIPLAYFEEEYEGDSNGSGSGKGHVKNITYGYVESLLI